MAKCAKSASWKGLGLNLAPRSFNLLHELADRARQGDTLYPLHELEKKILPKNFGDKALAKAIGALKTEMIQSGVSRADVQSLIENVRSFGYRLRIPASEIEIED